jgi:hypothetical protein
LVRWQTHFLRFIKSWLPILVVLCGGLFAAYRYWTDRADAERTAEITSRIEAQKPFLEQKLKLYLEMAQIDSTLTDWGIDPKSEEWKKATKRFWQLRWSELELAGAPAIRQAMRRLGQQINETEYDPTRDRHDLRWMVECLSDELRLSLEQSWGAVKDDQISAAGENLPSGCRQGREVPEIFPGMNGLKAPKSNTNEMVSGKN